MAANAGQHKLLQVVQPQVAQVRVWDLPMTEVSRSNSIHLAANTGRVIICHIADEAMAMVVAICGPKARYWPELVQWLATSALGEPIGTTGSAALTEANRL